MPSLEYIRQSSCGKKRAYTCKKQAKEAIARLISTGGHNHRSTLNAYQCQFCNEWHIGHNYKVAKIPPPPPVL